MGRKNRRGRPNDATSLDDLVDSIYEAALAPARWTPVVETIAHELGATSVWLCSGRLATGGVSYHRNLIWGARDRALAEQCAVCQPSPWSEAASKLPLGVTRRSSDLVPFRDLVRTDFYHDFVEPLQIHHCIGATSLLENGFVAIHSAYRPWGRGEFGDEEVAFFQRLVRHLRRADILSLHMQDTAERGAAALETLEHLALGVVLVDRDGRPVHLNRSAEVLVGAEDGLSLVGRKLHAWLDADTRALRRALLDAAGRGSPERGGELLIRRPSGLRSIVALVVPLRPEGLFPGSTAPAAALFLADPERAPEGLLALLGRLYGLTPAEARVALEVARGGGLTEVAAALDVSINTVRTQLAHVFAKTETRRQADLARLLSSTVAHLRDRRKTD